jgi:hypothetical protein
MRDAGCGPVHYSGGSGEPEVCRLRGFGPATKPCPAAARRSPPQARARPFPPRVPNTVTAVEIPELAELIWLFEDEPVSDCGAAWPVGLQSFRLRRADREVLFSLDPLVGDAYITLYMAGQEMVSIGRLRRVEKLTVVKKNGYEGLELIFAGDRHDPVILQTRPVIRLSWDVAPLGTW